MITHDKSEPKPLQEYFFSLTSKEWIKVIEEEMNSMKSN